MQIIVRDKGPFYFPGKEIGCLLVHGFTGSPAEMRPLGEYLHQKGFTVKGICLPGHGTKVEELEKTKWENWFSEVTKGYLELKEECTKVFVIGLSMGGALTLKLASGTLINGGIVSICSPIKLTDKKAYFSPFLKYFVRYVAKRDSDSKERCYDAFWYDKYPVKAVASLVQKLPEIKKDLRYIKCPVLVIQSKLDKTVEPESAEYIFHNVSSNIKEIKWLYNSGHVATLDREREKVFEWIFEFIIKIQGG